MNIAVIATMEVHQEDVEAVLAELRKVIEPSLKEDGCYHYSYGLDILSPTTIRIAEWWKDEATLDKHLRTPHVRALLAVTPNLRILSMTAKKFTISDIGEVNIPAD